ncbi:TetR/AcrR family transcriptional regulator [Microtetraspora sp. NBRC 13810]|uniref:TetR/AcrR family transcriptional regulator n=1 Tax=Microtetraspora sp. NBRC 13810 TaxID=3030990 RepID=UPI002557ADEE|nr:TetR/AcrR family transcriptional regulator [Microtetraspora sp. NBRC 13810]
MGNREKLLAAARQCLFDKGYERTTVRDLASTAGVSMAAIGYHFGSKEELLNQALFEALGAGDAIIGRSLEPAGTPGADPAEAFAALWDNLVQSFSANKTFWIANLEATLRAQRDPQLRAQMAAGQQEGRSGLARVLTGAEEATLPDEVIRTVGSVQLALMGGMMMQVLTAPESAPTGAEILAGLRALGTLAGAAKE